MPPRKLAILLLVCNAFSIGAALLVLRVFRPSKTDLDGNLNKAESHQVALVKADPISEVKNAGENGILSAVSLNKEKTRPDIVLREPSFPEPPAEVQRVWMVGYAVRGGMINVWLSDGRFLTEHDRELGPLYRNSVEIEGQRVWMKPPKRERSVKATPASEGEVLVPPAVGA